mgnify:CR=1 FL=1
MFTRTASQFSYQFWRYYYRLIKAANEIIDAAGGDEAKLLEKMVLYFAQAKALKSRILILTWLNLYARPYQEDKTALAIPIYRTQLTSEAAKKSSVEEVYKLIVKDLTDAIPMLEGYERPSGQKDQINQAVAKGMLAYAYLMMGENGEAARLTQEVIDSKEFTLMNRTEVYQFRI